MDYLLEAEIFSEFDADFEFTMGADILKIGYAMIIFVPFINDPDVAALFGFWIRKYAMDFVAFQRSGIDFIRVIKEKY